MTGMQKTFRMIEGQKFYVWNYGGFSLTRDVAMRTRDGLKVRWERAIIIYESRVARFGLEKTEKDINRRLYNVGTYKFKIRLEKNSYGKYAVFTNIPSDYLLTIINHLNDDNWKKYMIKAK